ncbi:6-phosphogluconolactonase [Prosthecochloris sp.]|uniref:6-phosphogluconolactonase n=1 Tax=Prosthecochloris sp. TaxID=290513 RepID=UPI0025D1328D|nr:6-phosphogluconolactonase [Prosthecochloris sp.]
MLITGTEKSIVSEAAASIANRIFKSVDGKGFCSLVLSGGNSPRKLYRRLAEGIPPSIMQEMGFSFPGHAVTKTPDTTRVQLPWHSIMLFWGDERCVPENHPDSNYRMVRETLIAKVAIPEKNIFPMPHVSDNYDTAAMRYEQELKSFFDKHSKNSRNTFPVFDIVILGMGPDGHTASLFPGDSDALEESNRWVIPVYAPQGSPPGYRLSLTLPSINNARTVFFFVMGENKKNMVNDINEGLRPNLPAGMINPKGGKPVWFFSPE